MKDFYKAYQTIHSLNLKSNTILVYFDLCARVNKENECWPSKRTVSKTCHVSVSTVTRSLRELEKAGMMVTVYRFELNRHNRQTSNIYKIFDTPQQFTQPEEPTDIEDTEPKQENFPDIPEPATPTACVQEEPQYIGALQMPSEASINVSAAEAQNYTSAVESASDALPGREESTPRIVRPNYAELSSFALLFCFIKSFFDTLPHVSMTPQGTIPGTKVTDNLRNKSILSKLTKWYKRPQAKKHAGLEHNLAKNE
jgi:GntR family transcriptional regulator